MEQIIDEAISLVTKGKLDFPGFLQMIAKAGVDRYEVDVATHQVVYFGAEKKLLTRQFPFPLMTIAVSFNEGAIKNAIKLSQAKEIDYPAFLQRIADAGVTHYETNLKARHVIYYGKDASYVEPFPSK